MADSERIVGATVASKYRIRRVIGRGSMGVVCEAEHLEIGKRVAIKLIEASLTGMNEIATRFRREARAASLVESHHIVQVFDVGSDDSLGLYLVMEYLAGEDLAQLLAREKRLAPERATRIALQVARGLVKAHEAGVVHRDLKPANIFLCAREDDEPIVKILDFGISKVIDSTRAGPASRLKLTRDGMVVGTPQYMSPEQAQGYAVDERSDVWALGLVLYEMLAGRPAYPELPTYEQFIIHLVSRPPDPLRDYSPWVSEELAGIVHGAVEHDLSKRIQTCAILAKRLAELQLQPAGFARPPEATQSQDAHPVPLLEDLEDDAPQFFDRKTLDALAVAPSRSSDEKGIVTSAASTPDQKSPYLAREETAAIGHRTWLLPVILFVATAVIVVAAFAFR
jgi:serine/threonine protein kinase